MAISTFLSKSTLYTKYVLEKKIFVFKSEFPYCMYILSLRKYSF